MRKVQKWLWITVLWVLALACTPQIEEPTPDPEPDPVPVPSEIAVESIGLDRTELTLVEGDQATLTATVLPEDATDPTVTWSSSDDAVATVGDGIVLALMEGSATITAQAGEKTASCTLTVEKKFIAVTSLELSEHTITLIEGEEAMFTASVLPEDATDPAVSWSSSDDTVATVEDGLVKALAPGEATISAQAGEQTDACIVTVEKRFIPVASVALSEHTITLIEGEEATLMASVRPDDATDPAVSWSSSNPSVATVENGQIKALAPGETTILAQAGEQTDVCVVTVEKRFIPVASIALSEHTITLIEGDEATLSASVLPDDATNPAVTWSSSNPAVATVEDGLIKALAPGEATITAQAGEQTDLCIVTVEKRFIPVASIALSEHTITLIEGEEATLSASVLPDDATDSAITWSSSNTAVATVGNGRIKALAPGEATILAQAGEQTDVCVVTVEKRFIPVASIMLSEHTITLIEGEEATLSAAVLPDDATYPAVSWSSSNTAVATVENGRIKALAPGEATISARAGEQTDACIVTVEKRFIPVTSIELNKHKLNLYEGGKGTLKVKITPSNATEQSVSWSTSDATVATVADGIVTALVPGKASITAQVGDFWDVCEVTVETRPIVVTSVTLDKTSLTLEKGQSETLTATVLPEDAADKTVKWASSDASVARVDQNGKVTALKGGRTTISATAGTIRANCSVTVYVPVQSVSLSKSSLTLSEGEEYTLTATVSPSDATDYTLVWSSSDNSVASVKNGTIKAVSPGTATITAQVGELEAQCVVTVPAPDPFEGIYNDDGNENLEEGEDVDL